MPVSRLRLASALKKLATLRRPRRRTVRRRRTGGLLGMTNLTSVGAGRRYRRKPGPRRRVGRPRGSALVGGATVGGRRRTYRRRTTRRGKGILSDLFGSFM